MLTIAAAGAACTSGPSGPRLYVTNEMSGDLSVIDVASRSVIKTIPLGKRPRGIRVSPDGAHLYVALSGSPMGGPNVDEATLPPPDRKADGIGVVDLKAGRLVRILESGPDPEQLAVSRDGRRLFVANEDAGEASIVDVASGRITGRVTVGGEPEGVELRPDGEVVYVTSEADNKIFVIDANGGSLVAAFDVGDRPRSIGFLADGSRAFVSAENSAAVTVVDAIAHRVIETVPVGARTLKPMGVVVSPDGRTIYVTTGRGRMVVLIDAATLKPSASIEVGERPWGVDISDDGGTLFTANGPSNDVSFVDVAAQSVVARVPVGNRPWGLVYVK